MTGPGFVTTPDGRRVPCTVPSLAAAQTQMHGALATVQARVTRQATLAAELRQLVRLLDHDLLECAQLVEDTFDDCAGLHSDRLQQLKTVLSRARARIQTQRDTGGDHV